MKAAVFYEHGDIDKLQIAEVDTPTPRHGEVLIDVKICALNRLDSWTRKGMPILDLSFPHIGGSDFAGIVTEVGEGVTNFAIGDRVVVNAGISCGACPACLDGEISLCPDYQLLGEHVWGGAAEFAVAPASNLLKLPDHISFEDAAASALTLLTTYRMIVGRGKLRPGEFVLVIGAGGGIGTMAIQVASVLGGRVIALTSSQEKMELARELGAEHVINYREDTSWSKSVWLYTNKKGVDIVIDSVGQAVFEQGIRALGKGGRYVTCGATTGFDGKINLGLLFWKQLSIIGSTMSSNREFRESMQLLFQGKVKPVIRAKFTLEQIKDAHRLLEDPEHVGKIILEI